MELVKAISKWEFEKKFPEISTYGIDWTQIFLENGTILLDSEWNGETYNSLCADGVKRSYKPVYKKNGVDNFEVIGCEEVVGYEEHVQKVDEIAICYKNIPLFSVRLENIGRFTSAVEEVHKYLKLKAAPVESEENQDILRENYLTTLCPFILREDGKYFIDEDELTFEMEGGLHEQSNILMRLRIGKRKGEKMNNREFIATGNKERVGNMMCEMITHGELCERYCEGCNEAKWNCTNAVMKMLDAEVDKAYID